MTDCSEGVADSGAGLKSVTATLSQGGSEATLVSEQYATPVADKKVSVPVVGQNFTNYGKEWAHAAMKAMPEGGSMAITLMSGFSA